MWLPDPEGEYGQRVRRRLQESVAAWFTTVAADGTPQPNPIWFLWDGAEEILIYNRPDAARLRHLPSRPQAALHLDGEGGRDIVVLTGTARVTEEPPPHQVPAYLEKYRERMIRVGGSLEEFSETYPVGIRFRPQRLRGF
jgi:PPOX class probable F420-dependent enzyme